MLIKFFRNGKGAGAGPVGYLVADKVLAYDDNRDLIPDADGQPITVTREPLPEVLRGNPDRTEALIDAIQSQTASVAALHGLLNEGSSYGKLRTQPETSLKLVKAAEERLRQN